MIPLSMKPYEIRLSEDQSAPIFLVRPATVIDRRIFEATLAAPPYSAPNISPHEIREALNEFAKKIASGDELGRVLEAVARAASGDADAEDDILLESLQMAAGQHDDTFKRLMLADTTRRQLLPILAVKRFLVGWRNVANDDGEPFDLKMAHGEVHDESLMVLGEAFINHLGWRIYWNLGLSEEQIKNFEAVLLSAATPKPSQPAVDTAPVAPKAAGKSRATTSRKTRR